jgi:hypothetical protein
MCITATHGPWSSMFSPFKTGRIFPDDFYLAPTSKPFVKPLDHPVESAYDAWLASRRSPEGGTLVPGARRSLSLFNAKLAYIILKTCAYDLVSAFFVPLTLRFIVPQVQTYLKLASYSDNPYDDLECRAEFVSSVSELLSGRSIHTGLFLG